MYEQISSVIPQPLSRIRFSSVESDFQAISCHTGCDSEVSYRTNSMDNSQLACPLKKHFHTFSILYILPRYELPSTQINNPPKVHFLHTTPSAYSPISFTRKVPNHFNRRFVYPQNPKESELSPGFFFPILKPYT